MKKGGRAAPDHAPLWFSLLPQAGVRRDHRWPAVVDRVDDLACIYTLEVDRRDPEVRMPELPLDNRQRDPFVGHLDRVSMPQLVWWEPPPYASLRSESAKLTARSCC